jgi:hypothetical protein
MTQVIRLKQIENGAGIANAITLAHPAAVVTSSAAPFAWSAPTQVGNIPLPPAFAVTGNTLTITPGDGSAPITFVVTIPNDVFLQQGGSTYDTGTGNLVLALNSGGFVNVPLTDLVPIVVGSTLAITLAGNGTAGAPVTATLTLDPSTANLSAVTAAGLLTTITTANSDSVVLTGTGASSGLTATVVISPAVGNALSSTPAGLFVTPAAPTVFASTETTSASGVGTVADPVKFDVKLQPDAETAWNFVHASSGLESDNAAQLGLGYTIVPAKFVGVGPFDLSTYVAALGWSSAEVIDVEGHVNGVYYQGSGGPGYAANSEGFDYSTLNAVAWTGIAGAALFDLDATDEVDFNIHIRAV